MLSAAWWNARYPVGTRVRLRGSDGRTAGAAWGSPPKVPIDFGDGNAGGWPLDEVVVLDPARPHDVALRRVRQALDPQVVELARWNHLHPVGTRVRIDLGDEMPDGVVAAPAVVAAGRIVVLVQGSDGRLWTVDVDDLVRLGRSDGIVEPAEIRLGGRLQLRCDPGAAEPIDVALTAVEIPRVDWLDLAVLAVAILRHPNTAAVAPNLFNPQLPVTPEQADLVEVR